MRGRITKRSVAALKAPGKGEAWLWDVEVRGFGARAQAGCRVSYVLRYGSGRGGRGRRVSIGVHGQPWRPDPETGKPRTLTADLARDEALRLLGMRVDGKDPAEERKRSSSTPTLEEFWPVYRRDHATPHKAASTDREEAGLMRRNALPALGKVRLDKITMADVMRLHLGLRAKPTTANRTVGVLSHVFTMARRWRALPAGHVNPCEDVQRFDEPERQRYLSPEELARVGGELRAMEERGLVVVAAALRVLLYCGGRPSEVITLRRLQLATASRLDDGGLVLIQKGKTRSAKGKTRERPLFFPLAAVDAMKAAMATRPSSQWVFPSAFKPDAHVTLAGLEKAWAALREATGLEDVRLYDLRHTFASVAAGGGQSLLMIGGLLGHTSPRTTKRYAHLAARPLAVAGSETAQAIEKALAKV